MSTPVTSNRTPGNSKITTVNKTAVYDGKSTPYGFHDSSQPIHAIRAPDSVFLPHNASTPTGLSAGSAVKRLSSVNMNASSSGTRSRSGSPNLLSAPRNNSFNSHTKILNKKTILTLPKTANTAVVVKDKEKAPPVAAMKSEVISEEDNYEVTENDNPDDEGDDDDKEKKVKFSFFRCCCWWLPIDFLVRLFKVISAFPFIIIVAALDLSTSYSLLRSAVVVRMMNLLIYAIPVVFGK